MDAGASGGANQLPPTGELALCVECGLKHEVLVATDWKSCERCTWWTCAKCRPRRLLGAAHSNWCRLCREGGALDNVKLSSIDGQVVERVMTNVKACGELLVTDLAGDPLKISRASGVIKVGTQTDWTGVVGGWLAGWLAAQADLLLITWTTVCWLTGSCLAWRPCGTAVCSSAAGLRMLTFHDNCVLICWSVGYAR